MQTRPHRYLDPAGHERTVMLVDTETFAGTEVNVLHPLEVVDPDRVLLEMADLGRVHGVALDRVLGSTGPLVASRAGKENAGNPEAALFDAKFGRDSEIIARFLDFDRLLKATVMYWAEREGRRFDPLTNEEPGARIHEFREPDDPQRARLEQGGMHFPDFGSSDAAPLWCLNTLRIAERDEQFLDEEVTHYLDHDTYTIGEAFARTLHMLDRWRAKNAEGLIEAEAIAGVFKSFPYWKDSPDAYHHKDGTLASPPVSTVEMMGYLYDTYIGAAQFADALGLDAATLEREAKSVQAALLDQYWVPASAKEIAAGAPIGYFALGTDRDPATNRLRKLEVRASNMGYLLDSGILDGEDMRPYREAVVEHLFSPEMLCPAGFRTLARDELRFSENGYHNGAVWGHDTYRIALGLRRYYPELALIAMDGVKRTCREFMPEFTPGNDDLEPQPNQLRVAVHTKNVYGEDITTFKESSPQPIQGWTAAARKGVDLTYRTVERKSWIAERDQSPDALFAQRVAQRPNVLAITELGAEGVTRSLTQTTPSAEAS